MALILVPHWRPNPTSSFTYWGDCRRRHLSCQYGHDAHLFHVLRFKDDTSGANGCLHHGFAVMTCLSKSRVGLKFHR